MAIQENEEHGVEYRDFDVQFDQGRQAVDGLSEVYRFWVEVHFSTLALGRIMVMDP